MFETTEHQYSYRTVLVSTALDLCLTHHLHNLGTLTFFLTRPAIFT